LNISVIIPTFNRKKILYKTINSVLNQTFQPYEIIVVDDGSTDGTKEWILNYYPNIKYVYQSNVGVSAARNKGINISKGDWLAFLDSDDEWFPKKLEIQSHMLNKNPNCLFCHTNEIWIKNGIRINQGKRHQKYGGKIFELCLDLCRISPSSVILNKSIIEKIGMFDEKMPICEDYDLWLRITSEYSIIFIDEMLIKKYGGHEGQLSNVSGGIEQFRIYSLEKIMNSKKLTLDQYKSARKILLKKLNIYLNGAKKRKNYEVVKTIEDKIEYWTVI
tara:strand:+ start:12259 stop:13083 length:825 start_codon:yes stop_codon:yes gene_type:complete